MKRSSILFLQGVIALFGLAILTFLLWEPHVEGANKNAKFFEVYLDLFVAYVYLASILFFTVLYQSIKVLGYVHQNKIFSLATVKSLRLIKFCAYGTALLIMAAATYIKMTAHGNDDPAGFLMLCMMTTFASIVVGTAAMVFERVLQNAVDIKSENDLTV